MRFNTIILDACYSELNGSGLSNVGILADFKGSADYRSFDYDKIFDSEGAFVNGLKSLYSDQ